MQGNSWTAPQYHFLEASSHTRVCAGVCVCSHVHKRPPGQKAASLCQSPRDMGFVPFALISHPLLSSPFLISYPCLLILPFLICSFLFLLFSSFLLFFLFLSPVLLFRLLFPFLFVPFLSFPFPFLTCPIFLRPLLLFSLLSSPVVAYKGISSVFLLDWLLHVGGPSLAAPSACWVMIIKLKYPGTYQCITSLSTPQTHSYFRGYTGESVIWYTARNRERTPAEKVRKTEGEGEVERE